MLGCYLSVVAEDSSLNELYTGQSNALPSFLFFIKTFSVFGMLLLFVIYQFLLEVFDVYVLFSFQYSSVI